MTNKITNNMASVTTDTSANNPTVRLNSTPGRKLVSITDMKFAETWKITGAHIVLKIS